MALIQECNSAVTTLRCPTCEKRFNVEQTTAMPFCSDRCRNVDLGRWFNEEVSLPHTSDPDDEESEAWLDEPQ